MQQVRIRVKGEIDERWSEWLDGVAIAHSEGDTLLTGSVVDQAALYGLIAKLRDLGLPLAAISVGVEQSEGNQPLNLSKDG